VAFFPPALALVAWLRRDQVPRRVLVAQVASTLLALAPLALTLVRWGGTLPPARRSGEFMESTELGANVQLEQLLLGLAMLGLWLTPSLRLDRRMVTRVLLLWPACGAVAVLLGTFEVHGSPTDGVLGPVSALVRPLAAAVVPGLFSWLAGAAVAAGLAALLWAPGLSREGRQMLRVLTAVYLAMMLLMPLLYEQYYLVLLVLLYVALHDDLVGTGERWTALAHRAAVAVVGLGYGVMQLVQIKW